MPGVSRARSFRVGGGVGLVFPPRHPEGIVAKAVSVFRVLEQSTTI
jgi:hypothetical protein